MRVFITGATGFIGQALVSHLRREGHGLVALVRDLNRAQQALGEDVALVGTADADAALSEALGTCDAVVNLAGAPVIGRRWTEAYRQRLVDSRVTLTRRIMAAIPSNGPRVIVSGSATGYYGDRGDEVLTEASAGGDDFLATLCRDWEAAAVDGAPADARVVRLRTGVVLGAGGGALDKMLIFFRSGVGGPIGRGRQYMPWIHLDDLTSVITASLTDERYTGPLNAAAPDPVTNHEFSRALGRALRRPALLPVPPLGLRMLFGDAAQVLLASQRAVPEALRSLGHPFVHPELGDALQSILS